MFKRRTWGFWIVLINRKNFKIKLLRFKDGGLLSKQFHYKRNEMWLILSGEGSMNLSLSPSESHLTTLSSGMYLNVSQGWWHQFVALKKTWVLEIQYGKECNERDIVRA